jgi:hypothetical protein
LGLGWPPGRTARHPRKATDCSDPNDLFDFWALVRKATDRSDPNDPFDFSVWWILEGIERASNPKSLLASLASWRPINPSRDDVDE